MATQDTIIKPGTPEARPPLKRSTIMGIGLGVLLLLIAGALYNESNKPKTALGLPEPPVSQTAGLEDTIDSELKRTGIDPRNPVPLPVSPAQRAASEAARAGASPQQLEIPPRAQRSNSGAAGVERQFGGQRDQTGAPAADDAEAAKVEVEAAGRVSKSVVVDVTRADREDAEPALRAATGGARRQPQAGEQDPVADAQTSAREAQARADQRERDTLAALRAQAQSQQAPTRAQLNESWMTEVGKLEAAPSLKPQLIKGRYVLAQGAVIPAVLARGLVSDLPGEVVATTAVDVYDSFDGHHVLIPKGARLVGQYNSGVAMGQERIMFAFTRLILPNGVAFTLPGAIGMDPSGSAGAPGDVNNHFFRMFGTSLLIALLADRVERNDPAATAGTTGTGQATGGARSAAGQVLVDTSRSVLERNRVIPPTITVPVGTRINVQVVRDMEFPAAFNRGASR